MVNQYNTKGPSYKFTLSASLIESVEQVLTNNSVSKEYVLEKNKPL